MAQASSLKRKIVTACRVLDRLGLTDAHGHLSARLPGTSNVLITPRESPGMVGYRDILTIDMDGKVVEGKKRPPSEMPIHLVIYRTRADVQSVCHFHSEMAVALANVGQEIRPLHGEGRIFASGVPIFDSSIRVRDMESAKELASQLGNKRAIVLRGHGAVVVGESVEMACLGSIYLERAARMQCLCLAIGTPKFLTDQESAEGINPPRVWDYYVNISRKRR